MCVCVLVAAEQSLYNIIIIFLQVHIYIYSTRTHTPFCHRIDRHTIEMENIILCILIMGETSRASFFFLPLADENMYV